MPIVPGTDEIDGDFEAYGAANSDSIWPGSGFDQVAREAERQQNDIDTVRATVELDDGLDRLRQQVQAEPDFSRRADMFRREAGELYKSVAEKYSGVEARLQDYYPMRLSRGLIDLGHETHLQWGQKRLSDTLALGDALAGRIAAAGDPAEAARYASFYDRALQSLSDGPGAPLHPDETERLARDFDMRIQTKRAETM